MSHNSAPGSGRVFLSAFIANFPYSSLRGLSQDKDVHLIEELLRPRSDNDATEVDQHSIARYPAKAAPSRLIHLQKNG